MTTLPYGRKIVIGLGSGRSGTASLASLIDRQPGGICFHEMNPSCAVFSGNAQSQLNTVREFGQILTVGQPELLGDIAYYYLNYVDDILALMPDCIFVCIKRDRAQTVASWLRKSSIGRWPSLWLADRIKSWLTREPFYTQYNYWQDHDGSRWKRDPVWDSCFPKFEAASKEEAIGLYWDYYYLQAQRLEHKHPRCFRVFDVDELSTAAGQREILSFIGLSEDRIVFTEDVHLHRSE